MGSILGVAIGLGVGYHVVKHIAKDTKKYRDNGLKVDMKRRSAENWERGRGAKKKGNPRYKPVRRKDKNDVLRKLYILRKK